MKTQHTPGEWTIAGQLSSCETYTIRAFCDEPGKQFEFWVADCAKNCAPLIAAAPDLMEACKAVSDTFASAPFLEIDSRFPGAFKAWKQCVAAIAKATAGES